MAKEEKDGGVVIYRIENGQIEYLLLKSATSDFWGFSKGHLENDEDYLKAAIREAKEETNLSVAPSTRFHTELTYEMPNHNHKKVVFYVAQVAENAIVSCQKEEISNYGWFDYEQALNQLTYDNLKPILKEANEYLKYE